MIDLRALALLAIALELALLVWRLVVTKWYEQANPGGPMVGPPFIRALYPPDASQHGKRPSDDGDDVEAIKRAVSRSGHWPWQMFRRRLFKRFRSRPLRQRRR